MKTKYLLLLFALTAVYSFFSFAIPVNTQQLAKYGLSVTGYRWVIASFVILVYLIWFAAFYGFSKFKDYAETIKTRPDGRHLAVVANGLEVLAIGVVLSSVLSSILQNISVRNLDMVPRTVIIENYISLIVAAAHII